jgi:gp16 family phage-associated protein
MNTNPITALLGPVTDREYLEYIGVIEPLPLGALPVLEFDGEGDGMTPQQVKEQFRARGDCVGQWADRNGFDRALVYRILNGRAAGWRGKSHQVAVALGLKPDPSKART